MLAPFASRIDHVDVFGSHATGRARDNSDIDLVIHGRLEPGDVDRLWTLFSESRLPVTVDVIAYNLPLYPPLKRHIDEVAKRLFDHGDLLDQGSLATR
ncbi:MAG: nucleotidyltransferase domain-containing protein [Novosphingobium sp.]